METVSKPYRKKPEKSPLHAARLEGAPRTGIYRGGDFSGKNRRLQSIQVPFKISSLFLSAEVRIPIFAFGLMSPISPMATSLVEGVMGSVFLTPSDSKVTEVGDISTIVAIKVMEFAMSVSKSTSGPACEASSSAGEARGGVATGGVAGAGAFWQPVPRPRSGHRAREKTNIDLRDALGLYLLDWGWGFFIRGDFYCA